MRREERVTVQGPVQEQQPDGMSHRGGKWASVPSPPPRKAMFFPPNAGVLSLSAVFALRPSAPRWWGTSRVVTETLTYERALCSHAASDPDSVPTHPASLSDSNCGLLTDSSVSSISTSSPAEMGFPLVIVERTKFDFFRP